MLDESSSDHTVRVMSDQRDRYFDTCIETLPRELLRRLQDHRLRWQFRRCWDGSDWYRARFQAAGLSPETFGGMMDLDRIPLLTDSELRTVDDATWRVAPLAWILSSTHSVSGLLRHQSRGDDVHSWDRGARWRWAAGAVRPPRELVAAEIGPSVYARMGRPIACGGGASDGPERPIAEDPVRCLDVPNVGDCAGHECDQHTGFHLAEDQFLAEIIDPATGQPLPDATPGELVVTDIVREASPLIRYRTGLVVTMSHETCVCGRTSGRIHVSGTRP